MLSANTWTCFAVCNVLKIEILVQAFHCSMLIAVIDNKIQTHTTFFLSRKLSVKAVQHSSQTAKLCSHCTMQQEAVSYHSLVGVCLHRLTRVRNHNKQYVSLLPRSIGCNKASWLVLAAAVANA